MNDGGVFLFVDGLCSDPAGGRQGLLGQKLLKIAYFFEPLLVQQALALLDGLGEFELGLLLAL